MFSFSDGFLMFSGRIKREHWEESGEAFNSAFKLFLFYALCKRQKTLSFLLFTEGIKSKHWKEIGEIKSYLC